MIAKINLKYDNFIFIFFYLLPILLLIIPYIESGAGFNMKNPVYVTLFRDFLCLITCIYFYKEIYFFPKRLYLILVLYSILIYFYHLNDTALILTKNIIIYTSISQVIVNNLSSKLIDKVNLFIIYTIFFALLFFYEEFSANGNFIFILGGANNLAFFTLLLYYSSSLIQLNKIHKLICTVIVLFSNSILVSSLLIFELLKAYNKLFITIILICFFILYPNFLNKIINIFINQEEYTSISGRLNQIYIFDFKTIFIGSIKNNTYDNLYMHILSNCGIIYLLLFYIFINYIFKNLSLYIRLIFLFFSIFYIQLIQMPFIFYLLILCFRKKL